MNPRPPSHSFTIVAFWMCTLETIAGIAISLTMIREALSRLGP